MAKNREKKRKEIEKLESAFKKAKNLVLIDYYGLKVKEINQLRKSAKSIGGEYLVTKKTLLKLVLKKLKLPSEQIDKIVGGIGLIFGSQDEVALAKLVVEFLSKHEKMKIQLGIFDGQFICAGEIKTLAKLPSRERLLRQLVWTIKSPIFGLVNVLDGNLRNLLYVINAIANKKAV